MKRGEGRPLGEGLDFLGDHEYSFQGDDKSEVFHVVLIKVTFRCFEVNPSVAEFSPDLSHVNNVTVDVFGIDEDVVNKGVAGYVEEFVEFFVYAPLEHGRSIDEAERHNRVFVQATPCTECAFPLIAFRDSDVVVTFSDI